MNRTEHRGVVEALSDFPRLLLGGHAVLQVAPGHVEAERIAIDVIERLFGGNIGAARLQRRYQLDFMVIILGERRIGMIRDGPDHDVLDRIGWLLEKEWRRAGRVGGAAARMGGAIVATAIN